MLPFVKEGKANTGVELHRLQKSSRAQTPCPFLDYANSSGPARTPRRAAGRNKGRNAHGSRLGFCLCLIGLLTASCVPFYPKPISPAVTLDDFEARRLDAPELKEFLQTRQGIVQWPPESWTLDTLTLAAFYYHPDLDLARAQWGVANGGMLAAGDRPNPAADVLMGYNSTTPADVVNPWIPEVLLGIPIETAGKRGIRITEARHISEAARWNIFTVAWQVRSRLRRSFLELYAAQETESLLGRQKEVQTETVRLLELQRRAGEVSPYMVTQARIALDDITLSVLEAARRSARARVQLADALGLPSRALDGALTLGLARRGVVLFLFLGGEVPPGFNRELDRFFALLLTVLARTWAILRTSRQIYL